VGTSVDELSVVVDHSLDETLLLEEGNGASGKGSVDLHSVDEGGLGDDSVSGDLLDDSVAALLATAIERGRVRGRRSCGKKKVVTTH
jgi:hypothetical protein